MIYQSPDRAREEQFSEVLKQAKVCEHKIGAWRLSKHTSPLHVGASHRPGLGTEHGLKITLPK